jgi:hypothetical protein
MYKIIGADGRPYGPVSVEQVREWITSRRANAQTLAQAEGSSEWKPLSAFPEFTEALAAAPPPPLASPPLPANIPNPDTLAQEILQRDFDVDIGSCFSRAWDLVKSDFWPIIGVSALILSLMTVASHALVGLILNGPLLGGLFWYGLKKIRGERAELQDAFAGFTNNFLQTMLGGLVVSLLVGALALSLLARQSFTALAGLFSVVQVLAYILICASLLRLRRRAAGSTPTAGFSVPLGRTGLLLMMAPVFAIAAIVVGQTIWNGGRFEPRQMAIDVALFGSGPLTYALFARRRGGRGEALPDPSMNRGEGD